MKYYKIRKTIKKFFPFKKTTKRKLCFTQPKQEQHYLFNDDSEPLLTAASTYDDDDHDYNNCENVDDIEISMDGKVVSENYKDESSKEERKVVSDNKIDNKISYSSPSNQALNTPHVMWNQFHNDNTNKIENVREEDSANVRTAGFNTPKESMPNRYFEEPSFPSDEKEDKIKNTHKTKGVRSCTLLAPPQSIITGFLPTRDDDDVSALTFGDKAGIIQQCQEDLPNNKCKKERKSNSCLMTKTRNHSNTGSKHRNQERSSNNTSHKQQQKEVKLTRKNHRNKKKKGEKTLSGGVMVTVLKALSSTKKKKRHSRMRRPKNLNARRKLHREFATSESAIKKKKHTNEKAGKNDYHQNHHNKMCRMEKEMMKNNIFDKGQSSINDIDNDNQFELIGMNETQSTLSIFTDGSFSEYTLPLPEVSPLTITSSEEFSIIDNNNENLDDEVYPPPPPPPYDLSVKGFQHNVREREFNTTIKQGGVKPLFLSPVYRSNTEYRMKYCCPKRRI